MKIYPLGWSKDGRFAYIRFQDWADGIGNYIDFKVIVHNLVNDTAETVYRIYECNEIYGFFKEYGMKVKEEDYGNYPNHAKIFHAIWKKDGVLISKKIAQYGIVQTGLEMKPFPYKSGKTSIDCRLEIDNTDLSLDTFGYYRWFKLWAESAGNGKKLIARSTNDMFINAEIAGYLKSPFEDRIAVVILKTYRGFEGPPCPIEPFIFGCHLTKGFK